MLHTLLILKKMIKILRKPAVNLNWEFHPAQSVINSSSIEVITIKSSDFAL